MKSIKPILNIIYQSLKSNSKNSPFIKAGQIEDLLPMFNSIILSISQLFNQINYSIIRTQGGFGGSNPPIGLSTKMQNKENITFLALLSMFFLQWHGLQNDLIKATFETH